MGGRLIVAVLTATLALAAPALAQPAGAGGGDDVSEVEALAAQAKQSYLAGDYGQAVAAYLRAYRMTPAAGLLYNVAVIYDKKLLEPDLATDFYRRYISAPDADPTVVERATARLQDLRTQKREAFEQATAPAPAPTPASAAVTRRTEARGRGSAWRTWGWVTLGVGAATAGVGAIFGVQAQASADDFAGSTDLDQKRASRDDGRGQAILADALYAVGGAAALAGLILLLTAPDDDARADAAGWGVTPTGDGAVLGFGGVF